MKKMILFAIPVLLTGLLQLAYNAADLIVVGQFSSSEAQGAIQSTGSLISLIVNVSMGLAVGVNVAVAKHVGQRDRHATSAVIHTSLVLSVIVGVVVAIFGYFLSGMFLRWMSAPTDLIDLSTTYLKIYFLGMPLNLVYNFGAAALRANGQTQKPLFYLFVSGLVNVGLNILFVLVFKMDVDGVAIATITSQAVAAGFVVTEMIRTKGYCKIHLKKLRIDSKSLWEIVSIGVPAGIQGSMFSISNVVIQSTVNKFGSLIVTANGNAQSIENFMYVGVDSVYQAALSFIGQNYGANNKKNIQKIMKLSFLLVTAVSMLMAAVVVPLRRLILSIYNTDPEIVSQGELRILINESTYFIYGWMQIFVAYQRGLGRGVTPVVISLLGICVLRIAWVYLVFDKSPTLLTLYMSYPVSWIVTGIAQLIAYLAIRKKAFKKMNEEYSAHQAEKKLTA